MCVISVNCFRLWSLLHDCKELTHLELENNNKITGQVCEGPTRGIPSVFDVLGKHRAQTEPYQIQVPVHE